MTDSSILMSLPVSRSGILRGAEVNFPDPFIVLDGKEWLGIEQPGGVTVHWREVYEAIRGPKDDQDPEPSSPPQPESQSLTRRPSIIVSGRSPEPRKPTPRLRTSVWAIGQLGQVGSSWAHNPTGVIVVNT